MLHILFQVFLVVFSIQCLYWIFILSMQAKGRKTNAKTSADFPGISVIVCANNELENLKRLLPLLKEQDYSNFEIIVVNDRSDDGTYDYLLTEKEKQVKVVNIETTPEHINAKKYAITLGIKAASHEFLLFTDADCWPESRSWIKSMSAACEENINFVIGYSQYEMHGGLLNHLINFETRMSGALYTSMALAGQPYMGVGRNLMYRKSFFLENKGFNKFQGVNGGDDDLFVNKYALGRETATVLGQDALIWSKPKRTWAQFFRQKVRHISVSKFYSFKDKVVLGLYSLTYLLFWITFAILATFNIYVEYILSALAVRVLLLAIIIIVTSKNFGERINIWLAPILDVIFGLYLVLIGVATLFTKRIKWR